MKKIITGFLTAAIVICIGTIGIYALGQDSETSAATTKTTAVSTESTAATTAVSQSTTRQTTSVRCKNYIDDNNDGICDHCTTSVRCENYIDDNNDGICDHCTSQTDQTRRHCSYGNGNSGHHHSHGKNHR